MTRNEEDQFYIDRITDGIKSGITSRRRLTLYTGVSEAKFTRLAGRAIIARKIVMLKTTDRHGGVLFGLYGPAVETGDQVDDRTKTRQAEQFLRELLADGPRLSSDVDELALTRGLRRGVLKVARANLGIVPVRDGSLGRWKMQLPAPGLA